MSWLARSLANSLAPDPGAGEDEVKAAAAAERSQRNVDDDDDDDPIEPGTPGRGVKEDLSELTKTLTRQFWGVASFLAPPPAAQTSAPPQISSSADSPPPDPAVAGSSEGAEAPESQAIAGIRGDLAEIGGRFRSGISRLSNNAAVSELSKIASTFLPFGSEEEEEGSEGSGVIGVTDEVLAFARNIAMHPETWLDFPLFHEEEDSDDFLMSNAQLEHAFAVENHEPRLAALRIELCPSHMSEAFFWKIYFVLLHSRLNKHDAELLSTPQIVEARARLLQRLQNQTKPEPEISKRSITDEDADDSVLSAQEQVTASPPMPYGTDRTKARLPPEEATTSVPITDVETETEKQAISTTEVPIIDKSVVKEEPVVQPKSRDLLTDSEISIQKDDEDVDDWLEEAEAEENIGGGSVSTSIPLGNDEDVSFSDLEEE